MELWQKFKSSASAGVPLVVNTQGWIKGLFPWWVKSLNIDVMNVTGMGYDLLSVFLAHIQPSHILHISSTDGRTPIFNSIFSKLTTSQVINIDSAANLQYRYLHKNDFPFRQILIWRNRPKFHASDYRTLSLVSYFMQSNLPLHQRRKEWDFSIPIASQTPYRVPWACVHIQFQAHEIPPSQMLYGLNGSIVALVSDKTQYTKQEGSTPFNDLSLIPSQTSLAPSRHNCVGLGIIRSIDITTGDFLLLTPVEPHLLSSVNLLIKGLGHGGIDVPVSLQMQGFQVRNTATASITNHLPITFLLQTTRFSMESQVPYTTFFLTEGIGALAKKTRALQRKRDFQ